VTSLDPLSRWTGVIEAINIFIKCAKRGPLADARGILALNVCASLLLASRFGPFSRLSLAVFRPLSRVSKNYVFLQRDSYFM